MAVPHFKHCGEHFQKYSLCYSDGGYAPCGKAYYWHKSRQQGYDRYAYYCGGALCGEAESSFKEVGGGVIEAAKSMGASDMRIICRVLIPEAKPSLIVGSVISMVTILGYSAMAGTIGGGGLGMIAVSFGYQRFNDDIIWVCVLLTIVIVQIIQEVGMLIARKTDKRIR